uniref:Ig-like domain-containing protein n=1 Tax=Oncorhynchus mykiss TaxID=8022 RepID=A0A8C7NEP9_ONCMY
AAPGSDFTLSCSFPSSKNLNLNHLVINWQPEESEVVHRTHLFEDQLAVGNASLRLNEQASTQEKLLVLVAVNFLRQLLSTFTKSGFIHTAVPWEGVMGNDITTMELDSRGRYELESEVTLRLNSTLTVTAKLRLRVLDQSFTKSLTLHPPPGTISGFQGLFVDSVLFSDT